MMFVCFFLCFSLHRLCCSSGGWFGAQMKHWSTTGRYTMILNFFSFSPVKSQYFIATLFRVLCIFRQFGSPRRESGVQASCFTLCNGYFPYSRSNIVTLLVLSAWSEEYQSHLHIVVLAYILKNVSVYNILERGAFIVKSVFVTELAEALY